MILSALVVADQLRAAIPCSLLSLSMVPFATVSLGIGAVSWVVPRKTTQFLDNTLYRAYMRLCLFVFENLSGVQARLFISRVKRPQTWSSCVSEAMGRTVAIGVVLPRSQLLGPPLFLRYRITTRI
ncbi:hypothetical protein NECAME_10944 [Necator americanus]|uniref:Uncharacterized protein n=1 Tax=Necator americanus TaxID=51031 RepID=W2T6F8_NECAM|nr:hypothetical protein NECAME_10944 [Necator americanus]ETN77595.1 hypothetical protein NECAME_10944 [Necator americanus]